MGEGPCMSDHYSRMPISSELERSAIALVNSVLLAIDERNYAYVRRCLADTVQFDTISLGGAARDLTAEEMIAGLQSTFRRHGRPRKAEGGAGLFRGESE